MLFNSYEFILFFIIVIAIYALLLKKQFKFVNAFLLIASLGFYGWWRKEDLLVLAASIIVNFVIGRMISSEREIFKSRPADLAFMGVVFNLSLLGYFKYFNFIKTNINYFVSSKLAMTEIALPLGISFFTFTQIAYLIDTYKNRKISYSFKDYSLFVTFFPHLLAGPIIHHNQLLPQFAELKKNFNSANISRGIYIFSIGLFKKVCIADTFAVWANFGFDEAKVLDFIDAWTASISYTMQLYFDFSGYSDMAIGLALIFGISFPTNFNSPYKAKNIQDFWRRWHITLSTFLRDYVYIPFGGSRKGEIIKLRNLFLTFLIGGIWHGAGWTFIVWGALHGIYSIIHTLLGRFFANVNNKIKILTTFLLVNFAWIFFRARGWDDAIKVIKGMFLGNGFGMTENPQSFISELLVHKPIIVGTFPFFDYKYLPAIFIVIGLLGVFNLKNSVELTERFRFRNSELILSLMMFIFSFTQLAKVTAFLYFNF